VDEDGKASVQIKEKGYAGKYRGLHQPIHPAGVESSGKNRNVAGFAIEALRWRRFGFLNDIGHSQ
jgi:hypothetical protein